MKPPLPRTLGLCADDFGLAPGISAGITRLARAGRLTAVSCIANAPHWAAGARLLADLPPAVDLGLHINLTEGKPLSPELAHVWPALPSLPLLMARAHLRLLPLALLRIEIRAQLDAFTAATGRSPAFVDGHQHVHHLPGLREIVLGQVESMLPRPAVRAAARMIGPGFARKRWLISHTGAQQFQRALDQRALAHNPALLGAYDFQDPDYRALMQGWLAALPPEGGLVFCHPGEALETDPPDAIAAARRRELAYLESALFAHDLAHAHVTLGRVWQTSGKARQAA